MDDADLLQAFDSQIRRRPESLPGFQAELVDDPAPMLRMTPTGEDAAWGGGVFWCDLDESTADAAIAATVDWFRPRGREFEWKLYGHDLPFDLGQRLRAAGFTAEPEETLMIAEVDKHQLIEARGIMHPFENRNPQLYDAIVAPK